MHNHTYLYIICTLLHNCIFVRDSLFRHFDVNIFDQSVQGIIGIELVNKATDYIVRLYSCYLPPEGSPYLIETGGQGGPGQINRLVSLI